MPQSPMPLRPRSLKMFSRNEFTLAFDTIADIPPGDAGHPKASQDLKGIVRAVALLPHSLFASSAHVCT